MRKTLLTLTILLCGLQSFSVDQRYMPEGYVRDDVIFPYFAKYTNEYFQKVDSKKIECNWGTYRREVNAPIVKILEQLDKESRQEIAPKF